MPKIDPQFPLAMIAAALLTSACAARETPRGESADAEPAAASAAKNESILASSTPSNGAKLNSAPGALVLNFARPVSLAEIVVEGPDGMMPMMLSPAGATMRYEIPLDGIGTGSYTVRWRAVDEAGAQHRGSIAFEVS